MIPRYLTEAYVGHFERELAHCSDRESRANQLALAHTKEQRLAVYLTWNGIIGFTPAIVQIMTEDFE